LPIAGAQRDLSFRVRALPVRSLDRAAQRSVAPALERDGDLQRRAVDRAACFDLAGGRFRDPAQPNRCLDRAVREALGADVAGRLRGHFEVVARAGRAALGLDPSRNARAERCKIGQGELPLEVELVRVLVPCGEARNACRRSARA
jgi:hypothetical protein